MLRRLVPLLLGCLLLHGCGGAGSTGSGEGEQSGASGREAEGSLQLEHVRPLTWKVEKKDPLETQVRLIRTLEVPSGISPWRMLGGEGRGLPEGRLEITGSGERLLAIPGPFEPSTFNRITLDLEVPRADRVLLEFTRAGEVAYRSDWIPILPGAGPTLAELDGIAALDGSLETLQLRFQGISEATRLAGLQLFQRPVDHDLPRIDQEPRWVDVGGDARLARVLRAGEELSTRFDVPAGASLEWALAVPALARPFMRDAKLTVLLQSRGRQTREEIALSLALGEEPSWLWFQRDLRDWSGHELEVRLRLEGAPRSRCLLAQGGLLREQPDSPTILMITSDTHRGDYLGLAGKGVEVKTPALDDLGLSGLYFEDVYSSTNITIPSHVSLLTGVHPRVTGVIDNSGSLAQEARTLAEAFRDAGYTCIAAVSSAHLSPLTSGLGQGFERFSIPEGSQRDSIETITPLRSWLEELEGRPLFVWLHLFDAHTPYAPPPRWRELYYPKERNPRDPELPKLLPHQSPSWAPRVRDLAYLESSYRAEVSYLDERLGQLFELEALSGALIALTSDHGESLGEKELYWTHHTLYPSTLNVPLILAGPQIPADLRGRRIGAAISHLDLGRTLLDLGGADREEFPGRNLIDLIADEELESEPRFAVAVRGEAASVEVGGWFLVLHLLADYYTGVRSGPELHEVELYNLREDPRCDVDLVQMERRRAQRLRGLLIRFLTSAPSVSWESRTAPSAELQQHIRALGYAESRHQHIDGDWFDPECECPWCEEYR